MQFFCNNKYKLFIYALYCEFLEINFISSINIINACFDSVFWGNFKFYVFLLFFKEKTHLYTFQGLFRSHGHQRRFFIVNEIFHFNFTKLLFCRIITMLCVFHIFKHATKIHSSFFIYFNYLWA